MVAQNKWLLEPEVVLETLICDTTKHITEQKEETENNQLQLKNLSAKYNLVGHKDFLNQSSACPLTKLCLNSILV